MKIDIIRGRIRGLKRVNDVHHLEVEVEEYIGKPVKAGEMTWAIPIPTWASEYFLEETQAQVFITVENYERKKEFSR